MDDEAKREQVREFLAALSPSERRRVIEFFLMQVGAKEAESGDQGSVHGLPRSLPENAISADASN